MQIYEIVCVKNVNALYLCVDVLRMILTILSIFAMVSVFLR